MAPTGSTKLLQWVLCVIGSTGYPAYDRQYQQYQQYKKLRPQCRPQALYCCLRHTTAVLR